MYKIFKKWWFWLIVLILVILLLPIWCNTYYLPDQITKTAVEKTSCRSIFNLFKVY